MLLVIVMMKIIFCISYYELIRQVSSFVKLLEIIPRLHKIGQSGALLGRRLGPLRKTGLSLIGNLLKPLIKSILMPLVLRWLA